VSAGRLSWAVPAAALHIAEVMHILVMEGVYLSSAFAWDGPDRFRQVVGNWIQLTAAKHLFGPKEVSHV
jgi:hypothetical protein